MHNAIITKGKKQMVYGIYSVEPHLDKGEWKVVNVINFHAVAVCTNFDSAMAALRLLRM